VYRIVVLVVVGVLTAVAVSHALTTASHAVRDTRTAAALLRCHATALDRYDAAGPADFTDPTARCAGVAKRLRAETGAGEAAVAPAPPGQ
jgi:type II secretory pathway pseudopilin PulG